MKKLLSILLCIMLASVLSAGFAFAEEGEEMLNPEEQAAQALQEGEETPAASPFESAVSSGNLQTVEAPVSAEGEIILEDYSVIEIPENEVEITEDQINNYISSIQSFATTSETVTEGTAQDGDTVNIDFSGVLAGEEEPFEGGTAQGYQVVLGSGTFIPGFEDQIIGHAFGETFDINVTFPEDYAPELAGKEAVFTIVLNNKTVQHVPEVTDEFVQQFSSENLDTELNTVDELRTYTHDFLYNNALKNSLMGHMQAKATINSYNESQLALFKAYSRESLDYYATMYASYGMEGTDADMVAQMNGFTDAESYTTAEAMNYLNIIMLLNQVAQDKNITVTDEEVDQAISDFMESYGYNETYSVEEFKEMSGEAWVQLITNMNVLYNKVTEALIPNVVFVEAETTADTGDSNPSEVQVQETDPDVQE